MAQHIVVSGNLAGGFEFYGPFRDGAAALKWMKAHEEERTDFDMIELHSPDDEVTP